MLMAVLREDLLPALIQAARGHNLASLSRVCQVALLLYVYLGKHMLLQLEAFITLVLLRLAEGKGTAVVDQQEAALEVNCSMLWAAILGGQSAAVVALRVLLNPLGRRCQAIAEHCQLQGTGSALKAAHAALCRASWTSAIRKALCGTSTSTSTAALSAATYLSPSVPCCRRPPSL